jgi:hypothetical protein
MRKNRNHERLLSLTIMSAALALSGIVVLKLYAPKPQHNDLPCPATVSLAGVGGARKVPLEVFMHK